MDWKIRIVQTFKNIPYNYYKIGIGFLFIITFILIVTSIIAKPANETKNKEEISVTPTIISKISIIPNSPTPNQNYLKRIITTTPTATKIPTPSYTPTPTAKIENRPIVTNTPSPTPTPDIASDKTAPEVTILGGPGEGSEVTFSNFCYPLMVSDNISKLPNLWVRFKFDSDWTDWSTNVAPCYYNVVDGSHSFSVQAKDQAGNISNTTTRNFTVNTHKYEVPTPTPSPIPTATPSL